MATEASGEESSVQILCPSTGDLDAGRSIFVTYTANGNHSTPQTLGGHIKYSNRYSNGFEVTVLDGSEHESYSVRVGANLGKSTLETPDGTDSGTPVRVLTGEAELSSEELREDFKLDKRAGTWGKVAAVAKIEYNRDILRGLSVGDRE